MLPRIEAVTLLAAPRRCAPAPSQCAGARLRRAPGGTESAPLHAPASLRAAGGARQRRLYREDLETGENMPTAATSAGKLVPLAAVVATLAPALSYAADAPVPNKGDTAWMLTSTALVLLMSVPALALFYGGLVRTKNMLSVLMQVFVGFSLITVLWCIYGYSLAFTEGNAVIGGLSRVFLHGTFNSQTGTYSLASTFSKHTPLYELVYVAFQATFAAITCCLILGAVVERIRFSALLLFLVIWFTFSYCPVAHMVWYWAGPDAYTSAATRDAADAAAGLIWQWGALDFAGGTVVHINAGVAGLVGAFVLGKRIGHGREPMA